MYFEKNFFLTLYEGLFFKILFRMMFVILVAFSVDKIMKTLGNFAMRTLGLIIIFVLSTLPIRISTFFVIEFMTTAGTDPPSTAIAVSGLTVNRNACT